MRRAAILAVLPLCLAGALERAAHACGCFVPPDPSVPIVQAGERILFVGDGGRVTAHIQIQYAGRAADFGWLLPLPSVPTLKVGSEELFSALINGTQPKYVLTRIYDGDCFSRGGGIFGGGGDDLSDSGGDVRRDAGVGPLVVKDSIGPYDYAVLRADDKAEMFAWLAENRFFVPTGTEDASAPYIRPGAYFLALKLRSGRDAGDIVPVIVDYASDLPMIPIVLTSVAAQPDMGIQVWTLGRGRAIPRNYFHTVLNDAQIDWFNAGRNYNELVIAATREAEGRHTFVTEFAGRAAFMSGLLVYPGRFGTQAALASLRTPEGFIYQLRTTGFLQPTTLGPTQQFPPALLEILQRAWPIPAALAGRPGMPQEFYRNIAFYLGSYRQQHPEEFVDWHGEFDPVALAAEVWAAVAQPILDLAALFQRYPTLTRLYTTLSPEQMDRDPVFSENPGLPDVSNVHNATLTIHCGAFGAENPSDAPATLRTEQGFVIEYRGGSPSSMGGDDAMPSSTRIETLAEEGSPTIVRDNAPAIRKALASGCSVGPGGGGGGAGGALLLAAMLGFLRWRARRPRNPTARAAASSARR